MMLLLMVRLEMLLEAGLVQDFRWGWSDFIFHNKDIGTLADPDGYKDIVTCGPGDDTVYINESVYGKHLATTPHVPSYIQSYDQVLNYNFDVYVSGHGIGTKEDVQLEKEYVDDLKNNTAYAIKNVNFTEATKGVDKNNSVAITEAYFNAMNDVCVDRTDGKWNGKLEGVGVWTDEHCEKMIISLRVD